MSTFYTCVELIGNNILFCGYKNGTRIQEKIPYKPTFYISSNKPSEFKTLEGGYVSPISPGTIGDCRDFIKQYSEVENFKIYGNTNYIHQFISDAFHSRGINWDRNIINVTTLDIEVQSDQGFPVPEKADYPVTAITVKNNIDNVFYVFGVGEWSKDKSILPKNLLEKVVYVDCESEAHLLMKFITHWRANYPDVLTGWNSRVFDTVYLVNRITKIIGEDMARHLSPWGILQERFIERGGREEQVFEIRGIQQLDFLDCFRKFGYTYGTQENYKLDTIAHVVLGENKIDYSEYGTLHDLYKKNYQLYIDYNIKDVEIVDRLEHKTGLITLAMTVAYKALVNMTESFGSVGVWDALIYNELRSRNIVIPPKITNTKERKIEGAYVKDPQTGMHEWVMSFDLNSLYPHIIMQYNMSPETVMSQKCIGVTVSKLLEDEAYNVPSNYCMSATGQYFDRTKKGIVPQIVESLYKERSILKKQMLVAEQQSQKEKSYEIERKIVTFNNQQMAIKILMNSLYGALSNEFFRYYDMRVAESITVTGQLTILWAQKEINNYLNKILNTQEEDYVIAIDTDSLYIRVKNLVKKISKADATTEECVKLLDQFASQKLEPLLEESYNNLCKYMNGYEQKMVMKREVIADKGIWTGKKHYALNVHNSEGVQYSTPKLKIMGIEVVRSSTPMSCRTMLKDSIGVIMNTNEENTQKYIQECREKFNTLQAEDIAFPRGVSDIEKFGDRHTIYKKSCPIHVRAALLYNHYININKIEKMYAPIYSGDKIKFLYLKQPNTIFENVIAFQTVLPEEINIRKYVDYDLQFQKAYLEPLKTILDAIGWSTEKHTTLEDFF
jgi:DNA polymerase elongation subunit (family B)